MDSSAPTQKVIHTQMIHLVTYTCRVRTPHHPYTMCKCCWSVVFQTFGKEVEWPGSLCAACAASRFPAPPLHSKKPAACDFTRDRERNRLRSTLWPSTPPDIIATDGNTRGTAAVGSATRPAVRTTWHHRPAGRSTLSARRGRRVHAEPAHFSRPSP